MKRTSELTVEIWERGEHKGSQMCSSDQSLPRWPKCAQELICMCHHTHPKAPVLSDFSLIFMLCQVCMCRHVGMYVNPVMMH